MSEVITVKVPDIGESSGVEVIEVSVSPGQEVEQDDAIITLESDKASMDIPCPQAGQVEEVLVKVGDKLSEGDEILRLKVNGTKDSQKQASDSKQESDSEQKAQAEQESSQPVQKEEPKRSTSTKTFHLPDLGTEGHVEVIEWSVQEQDSVEKDQTLLTLESDKASMDVPCPFDGKLVKKLVQVGDKVSTGTAVAEILSQDEAQAPQPQAAPQKAPEQPSSTESKAPTETKTLPSSTEPMPSQVEAHAGPGVRRLAHELGVDLTRVQGTGRKGRITYQDVHQFVKKQLRQPQGPSSGLGIEPMPEIDFSQWGEVETKPLSRIKRLTAKNLHRNWVAIPHVTQFDEADITELEAFRQENKNSAKEMGISLTPLAFIVKACVSSLKAYPQFNASLAANQQDLILKHYYNIGVAVDTPNGLVVPVIKEADRKGVYQIAQELGELSAQARKGLLKADQMKGSCFTVSSLGALGGTQFTPIINAPDVAILGVSKSAMKPVYQDGSFIPRLMMPLALSYDHRVIDGVEGAKFMKHLCAQCEDIRKLLL